MAVSVPLSVGRGNKIGEGGEGEKEEGGKGDRRARWREMKRDATLISEKRL